MSRLIRQKKKIHFPIMNNKLKANVRGFSHMMLGIYHPFTPFQVRIQYFNFSHKSALKVNILTTNKDSHNDETVFDPSQNERLDINPSCFMKMPFICPSAMMMSSELSE